MMSDLSDIQDCPDKKFSHKGSAKQGAASIRMATRGFSTDGGIPDASDTEVDVEEGSTQPSITEKRRMQNAKFEAWLVKL